MQQTLSGDFFSIAMFTLVGVFIILILLLRSLVAPVYLVLTVLLSYGAPWVSRPSSSSTFWGRRG